VNENRPAPHAIAGIDGNHGEICCCPNGGPSGALTRVDNANEVGLVMKNGFLLKLN
jgi:hypothetical protein